MAERRLAALLLLATLGAAAGSRAQAAAASAPAPAPPVAATPQSRIDALCDVAMHDQKLPSLVAEIVSVDHVVYARAFGFADREAQRPASRSTAYPIGSLSKVFTALLLAQLRDEGVVQLDDPLARRLPDGADVPADPRGAPITLRMLATHASGLPRVPVDLAPKDGDPYAGYTAAQLVAGLARTRLLAPPGSAYAYSNLGYGLLGLALERASGRGYDELLRTRLLEPLHMTRTGLSRDALGPDVAVGYGADDTTKRAAEWDLGALAPAGGMLSTGDDLAAFLAFELRAGRAGVQPVSGATLFETQQVQRLTEQRSVGVGLGWHVGIEPVLRVGHDGEVGGHHASIGLVPEQRIAVVLLTNCAKDLGALRRSIEDAAIASWGSPPPVEPAPEVEAVAMRLQRALQGEPAKALEGLLDDRFVADVSLAAIVSAFQGMHDLHGAASSHAFVAPGGGWPYEIAFTFRDGAVKRMRLGLDDTRAPKLTGLLFLSGAE